MGAEQDPQMVVDDVVVSLAYTLTVDNEVLDTADEKDAIQFLQGHKNIIRGLENQLAGMKVGESKKVMVSAEDGYGPVDKNAIEDIPLSEFPEGMKPEIDMELEIKDKEGNEMYGRVLSMQGDTVTMDFNHPLAGKELHFDVKVIGLRAPTPEEMAHDHVHAPGHHH